MKFLAPTLISLLFSYHLTNWLLQGSAIGNRSINYDFEVSPVFPWLNPIFIISSVFAFTFFLRRQKTDLRIEKFCRYTSALGIASISLAGLSVVCFILAVTGGVSSSIGLAFGFMVSIAFQVTAIMFVWKALRAGDPSTGQLPGKNKDYFRLPTIIALASAIHLFFPVRLKIAPIIGMLTESLPFWLDPFRPSGYGMMIDIVLAVLLACWFVNKGTSSGVIDLGFSKITSIIASLFAVFYAMAGFVSIIWRSSPYGGGIKMPWEINAIFAVTQILGIFILYSSLFRKRA